MSNSVATIGNGVPRNSLLRQMLVVSLTLNLGLALWLLRPAPQRAPEIATTSTPQSAITTMPPAQGGTSNAANSPLLSAPPFDWRLIESPDYRQYVVNLRAVGCPEQTIQDIIVADLNQLYAARARAILGDQPIPEFWQKRRAGESASQNQIERLKALESKKQSVFEQVCGVRIHDQELFNTLLLVPDSGRANLAFLPEDKREAAYRALRDANLAGVSRSERTPEEVQRDQEREDSALSGILSPEELEEYRMRANPVAEDLRGYLPYFDSTPEEFKALVKLREEMQSATNATNDPYVRLAEEAAAFARIVGETRGQEYARKADIFYVWARKAAERYGLPEDAPDRAWEIKRDAIAAVQQIHADTTLTAEERRRQLEVLHSTTEGKLVEALGVKGATVARRGDWWLQFPTMEMGSKP